MKVRVQAIARKIAVESRWWAPSFVKVGAMQLTSCRGRAVTRVSRRSRSKQRYSRGTNVEGKRALDGDEIRGSEGVDHQVKIKTRNCCGVGRSRNYAEMVVRNVST